MVHDGVGIDSAFALYGFEREVGGYTVHTGGVRRMLEMAARFAVLQRQHALLGGLPEGLCPLIRDRNWPGHLTPVAHRYGLSLSDGVPFFFFQAEDGIRCGHVTGVQTCALPI